MATAALILLALVLAWAVLYYVHWVLVRRRFVAISPGRVYQSGAMSPPRLIRCARRHSIDTIIDFRGAHEEVVQEEARALAASGIRHVNIPIGRLPTPADLVLFTQVMSAELAAGRKVLLHCKDGEGRAVALAAIYRIQFEGWSPLRAYRAATRLPPGFRLITVLIPFAGLLSRRNTKTQLILDYRPTPPGGAGGSEQPVSEVQA